MLNSITVYRERAVKIPEEGKKWEMFFPPLTDGDEIQKSYLIKILSDSMVCCCSTYFQLSFCFAVLNKLSLFLSSPLPNGLLNFSVRMT